jgi:hypothetical protein
LWFVELKGHLEKLLCKGCLCLQHPCYVHLFGHGTEI